MVVHVFTVAWNKTLITIVEVITWRFYKLGDGNFINRNSIDEDRM